MNKFVTKARTIDHLGRGQIADCPTAISELWKNAYDAYARNVSLVIYEGEPVVASVMDDGCGMTKADFLEKWLVVGTDSKVSDERPDEALKLGLSGRPRHGEKGIGRLSVAFLAPITLVLSKKVDGIFAAIMIDWRLFENPYLVLEDISLPVEEFGNPEMIQSLIPKMISCLKENLTGAAGPIERTNRVQKAWNSLASDEAKSNQQTSLASQIEYSFEDFPFSDAHVSEWPVYLGLQTHGTAIFMVGVHRELAVWVDDSSENEDEAVLVRKRLRETLTSFLDPYMNSKIDFDYEVLVKKHGSVSKILGGTDLFGKEDFKSLEHYIDGRFDENGAFSGVVKAFGKIRGQYVFPPARPLSHKVREYLGPFDLCIGTFEQTANFSTHNENLHAALMQKVENFGGLQVYRDDLRVMPYGRPDADFFNLEERRAKHAGREFWSHRRCFGRVAFTRKDNPNLKDKAGREGLVDNRPRREMQLLVQELLMQIARRFFGTDSQLRKDELPEIEKKNLAAKAAAEKARKARRNSFRSFLADNKDSMFSALVEATEFLKSLNNFKGSPAASVSDDLINKLQYFRNKKDFLRLPPLPAKLGELESDYRKYRDWYNEYSAQLDSMARTLASVVEVYSNETPVASARQWLLSNQGRISSIVNKYEKEIHIQISNLKQKWEKNAADDRSKYFSRCDPLVVGFDKNDSLSKMLNYLDAEHVEISEEISFKYESFLRTLNNLVENIDIDAALSVNEIDIFRLQETVNNFYGLAQVGISFEIIGHELESLDSEVEQNMRRLPADVRELKAYALAYEAHRALADRLRFLSPMKISGYRAKVPIQGAQIEQYIESFFERQIKSSRVEFLVSESFRLLSFSDLPSRIFPVFINLINNALYWVSTSSHREIRLDMIDKKVILADSGPGVDPEDVPRLFELFFTRRSMGRGVGLFLCRANLTAGGHKIRYADISDPRVLPGANFVIEFQGV